ncbi:MAG: ATP-dependent Clp protease adapter ClpS [Desulfatibacillum sp.]|nr:ATP-dependent Clp protease adapter ClpS [Desulfatibacillum sp.]
MSPDPQETQGDVLTEPLQKTERPRMFKVLLHNDDYTTMEFVVGILQRVFNKSLPQATRIMLSVHNQGVGVAGIFTAEVAETKIETVRSMAQADGFPLKCSMEPE